MRRIGRETSTKSGVASFDVFDTLLTRRVGDPRAAFVLLGRRLGSKGLVDCSPAAFAAARRDAEVRSFQKAGGLDSTVSIWTIYREVSASMRLGSGDVDKLVAEELMLERELLTPVESGVARLAAARARGDQIIFVSDMYLGEDQLADLLRFNDMLRDGDRIFVSSERARSKATGRMWPVVLDELGVEASRVHHTGNDERSDDRTARRAGLRTTLVDRNNLNRYETTLESYSIETDGLTSAIAGASRLARLGVATAGNRDEQVLSDVTAGAVAPFLIGKVLWLLEQAKDDGLEAIYFVSRDGKLLREIAAELAPKIGYTGELLYLYGSRQAWALPALHTGDSKAMAALCPTDHSDVGTTVRRVFARLDIDPQLISHRLIEAGWAESAWDRELDTEQCRQLQDLMMADEVIAGHVSGSAAAAHALALRYFEQVGLLKDREIGLVDLGTGATQHNTLSAILASAGRPAPTSFYLGLRDGVEDSGHGLPRAYLRDAVASTGFGRTPGLLTVLEMVCTDTHGSVTGYRDESGRIEPVFGEGGLRPGDWNLDLLHSTVRRVAAELVLDPDLVSHRNIDLRPAAIDAFTLFWESPDLDEARAWAQYPFEDGWGSDSVHQQIATRQTPSAAFRPEPHRHWWPAGAARLSDPATRVLLRGRRTSLDLIKRAKRVSRLA